MPLFILTGVRWLMYILTAGTILQLWPGFEALPSAQWWVIAIGLLLFATPFGRMSIAAVSARVLLAGLRPGDYPRGGAVHMRLWLAEQISDQIDAVGLAGAPWVTYYARALGAKIGRDVDMHTLPPITGMLEVGDGASIEPEVDLSGYWIDGDLVRIGPVRVGADATVGTRSTLAPGTRIGQRARDRTRLGRLRPRARRPVLGGLARRARGRHRRGLAGFATARRSPLGVGLRGVGPRARASADRLLRRRRASSSPSGCAERPTCGRPWARRSSG